MRECEKKKSITTWSERRGRGMLRHIAATVATAIARQSRCARLLLQQRKFVSSRKSSKSKSCKSAGCINGISLGNLSRSDSRFTNWTQGCGWLIDWHILLLLGLFFYSSYLERPHLSRVFIMIFFLSRRVVPYKISQNRKFLNKICGFVRFLKYSPNFRNHLVKAELTE